MTSSFKLKKSDGSVKSFSVALIRANQQNRKVCSGDPSHQSLCQFVTIVVTGWRGVAQQFLRALEGQLAEVADGGDDFLRGMVLAQVLAAGDAGGGGEKFGSGIDQAGEDELLPVEFRAESGQSEDHGAGEFAAEFGHHAGLAAEGADVGDALEWPDDAQEVGHVKFHGGGQGGEALLQRQAGVEQRRAGLQVGVEGFAGDEEAHDFAAAFEDCVDAGIAQEAFDRFGIFAAGFEAVGRLVAATAANLHGVIDDLPSAFGAPELGQSGSSRTSAFFSARAET